MKKTDHYIRVGAQGLFCQHCGRTLAVPFPIEIDVFAAMVKAFIEAHAYCEKPGNIAQTAAPAGSGAETMQP